MPDENLYVQAAPDGKCRPSRRWKDLMSRLLCVHQISCGDQIFQSLCSTAFSIMHILKTWAFPSGQRVVQIKPNLAYSIPVIVKTGTKKF